MACFLDMALRDLLVACVVLGVGCAPPPPAKEVRNKQGKEPTTAREKQLLEAQRDGEVDDGDKKWRKWRYEGDRQNCVYVADNMCFKTKKKACAKLACKKGTTCQDDGGGPIMLACK